MALVALIIGIGALAVSFGSLFFTIKVHINNRRISHEQRKQETLHVLFEARFNLMGVISNHRHNLQAVIEK